MEDNITIDGVTYAADEINGVKWPRTKVAFGPDGVATEVTSETPLPVSQAGVATEAKQDAGNTLLTAIRDALADDPTAAGLQAVIDALSGTLTVDSSGTTQPISATGLPLPAGAATETKQDAALTALGGLLTQAVFEARIPTLGAKAASGSVSTTPSTDQDPVFDHTNGVKHNVTTSSSTVITPAPNCKYIRVHAEGDCFIRTDGSAAADVGASIKILANQPETIPVVGGTAVTVIANTPTILRATPMKAR